MNKAAKLLGSWVLSIGLLLACGYLWLAFGIGNDLTPAIMTVLFLGAAAAIAALVTGTMQLRKPTAILQIITLVGVTGLVVHEQIAVSRMREADKPGRIEKNEALLASALSVLPCANGDMALLTENRHAASGFHSKSIMIVPRDRSQTARILVSASGKFKPPPDQDVGDYLRQSGTRCGNREYPGLMDLMRHIEAHHLAESARYRKTAEQ